nr:MAG TPA: hypothetical protein [Caudoviricetes sp.]DAZ01857.1 MAG TPA: hypothetical protein [Caudoviricetes sp.]
MHCFYFLHPSFTPEKWIGKLHSLSIILPCSCFSFHESVLK